MEFFAYTRENRRIKRKYGQEIQGMGGKKLYNLGNNKGYITMRYCIYFS